MTPFFAQVPLFAVLLFTGLEAVALRHYNIVNKCPSSIDLSINGESQGPLAAGASAARDLPNDFNGFIFTLTNGGNGNDGTGFSRAGFRGDLNYYFVLIDPNHLNTGISVTPIAQAPHNGFCVPAQCNDAACTTAFKFPNVPTKFPAPVPGIPPKVPLYECPAPNTGYTVTFCPTGQFPNNPPKGAVLHPQKAAKRCLDVRGNVLKNGTPVQIFDCNGTGAQNWVVKRGSTKVQLAGTNFCLDAGSTPKNGVGMKIWQCFDNLPAQQWFYTDDNRIALEGKGLCLDLTNGVTTNSNQVQTWKCTNGNTNQIWNL